MVGCRWLWWFGVAAAAAVLGGASGGDVTYDGRSLIIDGQRKLLFSGSIHYPRSTPDMWPSLISKAKQGGLDAIDTYVFWNLHEPQPGQYDFSGRRDIVRFIKLVEAQGLYVCLRIGPFIESEWSYGGLPFWLHDVSDIVFRSDNEPFKNFTTKIVEMMKSEKLYASQGGPIIISQIENEYQNVERSFRDKGPPYVRWAAAMAVGLNTGVPWVMCKQDDAPGHVINACNGLRCGETFIGPNSPIKPAIWTENWTHFYDYHGGTNFGHTASTFVITSYYDQAPLDEYGLIRQPKWGHLKELHEAVKLCSQTILYGQQTKLSLGTLQEAYVYSGDKGECAAFLVNTDVRNNAEVRFLNRTYRLPFKSISILPDCKTVAFNTAKVSTQFSTRSRQPAVKLDSPERWEEYNEVVPVFDDPSLKSDLLLEQMSTTKDASDYLWYTASEKTYDDDGHTTYHQLEDSQSLITVKSRGHVLRAFVNGAFIGSGHGIYRNTSFTLETEVALKSGVNNISLLSIMVGLPDSGAYMERRAAGLQTVSVEENQVAKNLTNYQWGYQVGLLGERLRLYTEEGQYYAQWTSFNPSSKPLKWYKSTFDAPEGTDPVALNLGSMGKGEAWVNGQSIGRYWISFLTPAGTPSQIWNYSLDIQAALEFAASNFRNSRSYHFRYHIPRSFLKPTDNLLVLFEEEIGNPLGISVDTVSVTKVCGHVSDSHPPPVASWIRETLNQNTYRNNCWHRRRPRPKVQLHCPPNTNISKILFASFGSPTGDCDNYGVGSCHSVNSRAVVERGLSREEEVFHSLVVPKIWRRPVPRNSERLVD
ncbi:hypothetical protein OROHE_018554 [Orobanche hederae]